MAWDFDEGGKFGSEKAAEDYARRNGLNDADFRTRRKGDQVELGARIDRGELAVDTPEIGRRLDRLENLLRLVIAAIVFAAMVVGGALLWGAVPCVTIARHVQGALGVPVGSIGQHGVITSAPAL